MSEHTIPQESTLLSFIAQRHAQGLEDVVTNALYFILSRSASARQALSELLGDEQEPLPIAQAEPWAADEHGAVPDLACLDKDGNLVALIECKFWAPLTHHQPVTYWQSLPTDRRAVLLFIAPDYRVNQGSLWKELQDKLAKAGCELGPAGTNGGPITAQSTDDQRCLMLTTWQLLLERMAQRAKADGDIQAGFETDELKGLADSVIEGDRPTRDENLKVIIAEVVKRVEQSKWADTKGLTVGQGTDFYGRYLRLAGAAAWIGIDYRAAKEMPGKLLWLLFYEDDGVDGSVRSEEIRNRLKGLPVTELEWRAGNVHMPIDLPTNADRAKTLEEIVTQLKRAAKLIDPEGPTYR